MQIEFLDGIKEFPFEFGNYQLQSLVSSGNALVFKALQRDPQRIVALKVPKLGALQSKGARDRFQTEYALAAGLRHPSIVPVLEVGQYEGIPYYTMPFIDGHTLLDYVSVHGLDRAQKVTLYERIVDVVSVLHNAGLIHRDLKSENIMVDEFGELSLLDFGLATELSEKEAVKDETFVAGTIRYMSPEQASGVSSDDLGFQSDVFSLGVIGFRLISGSFPYELPESKALALSCVRQCEIDWTLLDNLRVPFKIKNAIFGALKKDPSDRPRDANILNQIIEGANTVDTQAFRICEKRVKQVVVNTISIALISLGVILCSWGVYSFL